MKQIITMSLIAILAISSCKKKDDPVTPANTTTKPVVTDNTTAPQVKISFKNVVNGQELVLKTGTYTNANGDSFSVLSYKYYISNIVLIKEDGTEFKEPESYHLISEDNKDSKELLIKKIPAGKYSKIHFMLGVDSLRNVSGAQTGALDPANNMFWSWNTGYIMAKLEGSSPQSTGFNKNIIFHLGGFNGPNNVVKEISMDFPDTFTADTNKTPGIFIHADVAEWFKTPVTIGFDKTNFIMTGGYDATILANNYADMFSIDHITQ